MKRIKSNIKFLPVLLLAVMVGACGLLNEQDRTYTGGEILGFKIPNPAGNIDTVQTVHYEVQLIRTGGVLDQPLKVQYEIVDSTTTAVAGASYQIQTPSPVTIPKGALSTDIVVSFDTYAIPKGEFRTLDIQLLASDQNGIKVGENLGLLHVLIEGTGTP